MKNVIDNKQCFQTNVSPTVSITQVLRLAQDEIGHIGTTRPHMPVYRLNY